MELLSITLFFVFFWKLFFFVDGRKGTSVSVVGGFARKTGAYCITGCYERDDIGLQEECAHTQHTLGFAGDTAGVCDHTGSKNELVGWMAVLIRWI